MSVQRIAGRYAKSLIDLAQEQNKLERVNADLESFRAAAKNRDLHLLLKSPVVKADKKQAILEQLFAPHYDQLTMAFLRILVSKGREPYLAEIAGEFAAQYKRMKHITPVKITTAQPLSPAALEALRSKLERAEATDQKVEMESHVNPELIGGYVLEIEDKIYDASVLQKLEQLKREFKGNLFKSQIVAK